MPKLTNPTKSFIILFCVAVFGVFLTLNLLADMTADPYSNAPVYYGGDNMSGAQNPQPTPVVSVTPAVDISKWKTYSNAQFSFSFKYPAAWKIVAGKKTGDYTVFQVDPGIKYYNIKIYVSAKDYYAMGGLPTKADSIGNRPALNVNNILYGLKNGGYFYTFDVGQSLSLTPNFDALVHSVTFGN